MTTIGGCKNDIQMKPSMRSTFKEITIPQQQSKADEITD